MIDLSVIIVSYNTKKLTLEAVKSVMENTGALKYEIIVIDNNSSDGSRESLEKLANRHKNLTLKINKENLGFGQGNNQGMKTAKGRYILLLNSDTLIKDDVLEKMVFWMDKNPKVGITSCALKNSNGSIQGTGGYFPTLWGVFSWMTFLDDVPGLGSLFKSYHPMHGRSPFGSNTGFFMKKRAMDWVTAAFFMIRREVFSRVGYFDKDYFMYVEEVDYCFRVKKSGWEIWYLPEFSIIHYGGASSDPGYMLLNEIKGLKVFYKKHMPAWNYPLLIFLMKLGTFLRILIFGKSYAKIFSSV